MRKSLDWRTLKGLHKLYCEKRTRNKLMQNDYVQNVLFKRRRLVDYEIGNKDIIIAKNGFNRFFETELLDQYEYYCAFFNESGLDSSALKKYDQYDLQTLMFIHGNSEELRRNLTTARIFSSNVFKQKDSKYLENRQGLLRDVKFLLDIDDFPDKESKDNQWRFVVDCDRPKYILLCENLDFLKAWWEFSTNNIELWYVGGNNTPIVERLSQRQLELPLFYVGDWDYDGLSIYSRIKSILQIKEKSITLVTPKNDSTLILKPIDSGNHKSSWRTEPFSNLNPYLFTMDQKHLISKLIKGNYWIEEQTIDPIPFILQNYD